MNPDVRFKVDGKVWHVEVQLSRPPKIVNWRVDDEPTQPAAPGLGDAVAAATKAVGVKPCGGCQRRQEALNRATPGWASRLLGRLGFGGSRLARSPGPPAR
jgi:hypothetical protein